MQFNNKMHLNKHILYIYEHIFVPCELLQQMKIWFVGACAPPHLPLG